MRAKQIGVLLVSIALIICALLPFKSATAFGPVVNGEETFIYTTKLGIHSLSYYLIIAYCAFCMIQWFSWDKKASIITLMVFMILFIIGSIWAEMSAPSWGATPFVPETKYGYRVTQAFAVIVTLCSFGIASSLEDEQ